MLKIEAEGTVGEDRVLRVQLPAETPTGQAHVVVTVDDARDEAMSPEQRIAAFQSLRGILRGSGDSVAAFLADRRTEDERRDRSLGL